MKSSIMSKVEDTNVDHETHNEFRKDCSSCFIENMVARQSARNHREEWGISRNRFSDEQISPNPFL